MKENRCFGDKKYFNINMTSKKWDIYKYKIGELIDGGKSYYNIGVQCV
jgi:hypothetical protein